MFIKFLITIAENRFSYEKNSFRHRKSAYAQSLQTSLTQRIADEQKRKEIEMERRRKEMTEEKEKDCTFRPAKGKAPPPQVQPVIVNGLSKFLEQKEAARRKADEELQAQQEAWGMKGKGITIISRNVFLNFWVQNPKVMAPTSV